MIIAAFPKGSYPDYTWPDYTWPAAFEDTTNIQYTEVMAFTVAAILSASWSVKAATSTALTVVMPQEVNMTVYQELSK